MQERTLQFVSTPLDKPAARARLFARCYLTGFTMIEMLVVVGIVALLMVFGIPAVRTMVNSFHSDGSTRAMINSALCCARAMAAKEQTYAGVRFQKAYNSAGPLNAPQYMIFIVYDPQMNPSTAIPIASGFRAVEGMEPIKLPDGVGVTDYKVSDNTINSDVSIGTDADITDATTFSIVFSPAGRLVVHEVEVWNRRGRAGSEDYIFNTINNVANGTGMFVQDNPAGGGSRIEQSRNSFVIYDENILKKIPITDRYSKYFKGLENSMIYVNPYTGTLINNR